MAGTGPSGPAAADLAAVLAGPAHHPDVEPLTQPRLHSTGTYIADPFLPHTKACDQSPGLLKEQLCVAVKEGDCPASCRGTCSWRKRCTCMDRELSCTCPEHTDWQHGAVTSARPMPSDALAASAEIVRGSRLSRPLLRGRGHDDVSPTGREACMDARLPPHMGPCPCTAAGCSNDAAVVLAGPDSMAYTPVRVLPAGKRSNGDLCCTNDGRQASCKTSSCPEKVMCRSLLYTLEHCFINSKSSSRERMPSVGPTLTASCPAVLQVACQQPGQTA